KPRPCTPRQEEIFESKNSTTPAAKKPPNATTARPTSRWPSTCTGTTTGTCSYAPPTSARSTKKSARAPSKRSDTGKWGTSCPGRKTNGGNSNMTLKAAENLPPIASVSQKNTKSTSGSSNATNPPKPAKLKGWSGVIQSLKIASCS